MKIVSALKASLTGISRLKEMLSGPPAPSLVTAVEQARRDWQHALREMDYIDGELTEYIIFKINAAERRYMALLEKAKKEGVTAWPAAPFNFPANAV
ncbi:MAG: YaaL family protein [Peptococcaceae bacterium]|nr:YaaL family protein [Peptococcaceae bacterium]